MDNTPNIDDFLAYLELVKSCENIENLSDEDVLLLDVQLNKSHNLPTNRAMLIMKAALAIEEILHMKDYKKAYGLLEDLPIPRELRQIGLAAGFRLFKTRQRSK